MLKDRCITTIARMLFCSFLRYQYRFCKPESVEEFSKKLEYFDKYIRNSFDTLTDRDKKAILVEKIVEELDSHTRRVHRDHSWPHVDYFMRQFMLLPFLIAQGRLKLGGRDYGRLSSTVPDYLAKINIGECTIIEFNTFDKDPVTDNRNLFRNLKVLHLFVCFENDDLKSLMEICPALEVLEIMHLVEGVNDEGLQHLGNLQRLKFVNLSMPLSARIDLGLPALFSDAAVVTFLLKCRHRIEAFFCDPGLQMRIAHILDQTNEKIPSIIYLEYDNRVQLLSKSLRVFPNVQFLLIYFFEYHNRRENWVKDIPVNWKVTQVRILVDENTLQMYERYSRFDVFNLLREVEHVFPNIISFSSNMRFFNNYELAPKPLPVFPHVTTLSLLDRVDMWMLSYFMAPGNRIKVLRVERGNELFTDSVLGMFTSNLKELQELELKLWSPPDGEPVVPLDEDLSFISEVAMSLRHVSPSFRLFTIFVLEPYRYDDIRTHLRSNHGAELEFVLKFRYMTTWTYANVNLDAVAVRDRFLYNDDN